MARIEADGGDRKRILAERGLGAGDGVVGDGVGCVGDVWAFVVEDVGDGVVGDGVGGVVDVRGRLWLAMSLLTMLVTASEIRSEMLSVTTL